MDYPIREVLRKVAEVIDRAQLYDALFLRDLYILLPSPLVSRLQMYPDRELPAKVNHLRELISITENPEPLFGPGSRVVSLEGINEDYPFDHDLLVETERGLFIVDATSDERLVEKKYKVLNALCIEHRIANGYVHVFHRQRKPFRFSPYVHQQRSTQASFDFLQLLAAKLEDPASSDETVAYFKDFYGRFMERVLEGGTEKVDHLYLKQEMQAPEVSLFAKSLRSNSLVDFLTFAESGNPELRPFVKVAGQVLESCRKIRKGVKTQPAMIYDKPRTMASVLLDLSENPICSLLEFSLRHPTQVCVRYREGYETGANELAPMHITVGSKAVLDPESPFLCIAKHESSHVFRISFHPTCVDDNFRQAFGGEQGAKKEHFDYPPQRDFEDPQVRSDFSRSIAQHFKAYDVLVSDLVSPVPAVAPSDVWNKLDRMCSYYTTISPSAQMPAYLFIQAFAALFRRTRLGSIASHDYEIAKSVSASLKVSPHRNQYYLSLNGNYRSITLTRCSSTLDSFSTSHYLNIYAPLDDSTTKARYSDMSVTAHGRTIQSKFYTLNKRTLSWHIRRPYMLMGICLWHFEVRTDELTKFDVKAMMPFAADMFLHLEANRDHFAQIVSLCRPVYVAGTGYGNTLEKVLDKFSDFRPKSYYELRYALNLLKTAGMLQALRKSGNLSVIHHPTKPHYEIAFPHSRDAAQNHDEITSAMNFKNIYLKVSAFSEVKDAASFNTLTDEDILFRAIVLERPLSVLGMTVELCGNVRANNLVLDEGTLQRELDLAVELYDGDVKRFQCSMFFILSAAFTHMPDNPDTRKVIRKKMTRSTLPMASMHGAMENGPITMKAQSLRKASSVMETAFEVNGIKPDSCNQLAFVATMELAKADEQRKDSSVLKHLVYQYGSRIDYNARIFKKDEPGVREIAVQNGHMAVGTKSVEMVADLIGEQLRPNVVIAKDKSSRFCEAVKHMSRPGGRLLSDNNDQSRWGPGQLMHTFSALLLASLHKDVGLWRLLDQCLQHFVAKKLKVPESLLRLFAKKNHFGRSRDLQKFWSRMKLNISLGSPLLETEWGMCQGLMHSLSSVYHSLCCLCQEDLLERYYRRVDPATEEISHIVEVQSFVTSDDSTKLIRVCEGQLDSISVFKRVHVVTLGFNNLFNISRNPYKSSFTYNKPELNSEFYDGKSLALPTFKFIISKIDCGQGENLHEDMMSALQSCQQLFTSGGSFIASVGLCVINVAFVVEQWRMWSSLDGGRYSRCYEAGGLPRIDPCASTFNTTFANTYLSVKDHLTPQEYATFIVHNITAPPEVVRLSDYRRNAQPVVDDVRMLVASSANGITSTSRSKKKLSQFVRRHKIDSWTLPPRAFTLDRDDPDLTRMIFVLRSDMCTSTWDEVDAQSFTYKRFGDPQVNALRPTLRFNKRSPFVGLIPVNEKGLFSFSQYMDFVKKPTAQDQILGKMRELALALLDSTQIVLRTLLTSLFEQAEAASGSMVIEGNLVTAPRHAQSHYTFVPLTSLSPLDADDQMLRMLKAACGEESRLAISRYKRSSTYFDNLTVNMCDELVSLPEGLRAAQDHVMVYTRYTRSRVKALIPGPEQCCSFKQALTSMVFGRYLNNVQVLGRPINTTVGAEMRIVSPNPDIMEVQRVSSMEQDAWVESKFTGTDHADSYASVEAAGDVITPPMTYRLCERPDRKAYVLSVKTKSQLVNKARHLFGVNVSLYFDENTLVRFCTKDFIGKREIAFSGSKMFRAGCDAVGFRTDSGEECLLVTEFTRNGREGQYVHHLWVPRLMPGTTVVSTLFDPTKAWARELHDMFSEPRAVLHLANRNLRFDTLKIYDLNRNTNFEMVRSEIGTGVFFSAHDTLIPIYLAGRREGPMMAARYLLAQEDLLNGTHFARSIRDYIYDDTEPKERYEHLGNFLGRGTHVDTVARHAVKLAQLCGYGGVLNPGVCDVARGLSILACRSNVSLNTQRIQYTIGNMFVCSENYYNGMTSLVMNHDMQLSRRSIDAGDIEPDDEIVLDLTLHPAVIIDQDAVFMPLPQVELLGEPLFPAATIQFELPPMVLGEDDSDEDDPFDEDVDMHLRNLASNKVLAVDTGDLFVEIAKEQDAMEAAAALAEAFKTGVNETHLRERESRYVYSARTEGHLTFQESYQQPLAWLAECLEPTIRPMRFRGCTEEPSGFRGLCVMLMTCQEYALPRASAEFVRCSGAPERAVVPLPAPFHVIMASHLITYPGRFF